MICAVFTAGCDSPRTQLADHELSEAAQGVERLAAEAELLASQRAAGSVSTNFAWVHQQALAEESIELSQRMARPVPQALRQRHEDIATANSLLQAQVLRIAQAGDDADQLIALQRALHRLSRQARTMEDAP